MRRTVGSKQLETVEAGGPAPAAEVPLKLVVLSGPDEGKEAAMGATATVGADPASTLALGDRLVSRRHVVVTREGGRIVVEDIGSRNGTFVGGTRIHRAEVSVGAVLTVGETAVAIHPRWQVREVAPSSAHAFGELCGTSLAMRELFGILERVSPTTATVLIEGESGTGKELAARSIHAASARRAGPYVVFDCAAVPPNLAESELFGHKRGAFSGATADRTGAFQQAHGGTLLLDEMGELPLELQPKLLRALETGEVRAVGDDTPRKSDVRVVAATNRDLRAEAQRGRFRTDLLYRLDVVKVRLPPLRQRPEDIPLIADKLLEGKLVPGDRVEGPNLDKLMGYGWPGNVRELRNVLTRAVALAGEAPRFAALAINLGPAATTPLTIGAELPGVGSPLPFKVARAQLLRSFERAYLSALLERHGGNVARAAQAAGVSRQLLYDLMHRVDEARGDEDDD
jgi:DNA-binding NtrC family response regulator